MSWNTLDPAVRTIATQELTPKQLAVLRHRIDGHSWRTIGLALHITEASARGRYERALTRLEPHLRKDAA